MRLVIEWITNKYQTFKMNKIAIVTGGGSGLGLAIAKAFTQNNITTIIVGRDEEKLKAASQCSWVKNVFYKTCDLSNLAIYSGFN